MLLLKAVMLKNKEKILLMSLLLHIELQNFLNAPNNCLQNKNQWGSRLTQDYV